MINSPANLEILLHCYYSPKPPPRYNSSATKTAVSYLLSHDMIKIIGYVKEESKDIYDITEKGIFYLKHIFKIPFPIMKWEIASE